MATRMQQRRGTAAQWTAANPILAAGEIGFETDTSKFKMGNGSSAWAALTYFANSSELAALITGAPGTLDTLNELAAAINDDPNFFTSVANQIADAVSGAEVDQAALAGVGIDWNAGTNKFDIDSTVATTSHVSGAVQDHSQDTSSVHGITDTLSLVTLTGSQSLTNKTLQYPAITSPTGLVKNDVGLPEVDNTSDANKPLSNTAVAALELKANLAAPTFTGTVTLPSTTLIGDVNYSELSILNGATITTAELNHVDGVTSAIQTQIDTKAPTASPTFTGTVSGVTAAHVGLGNVNNTSDANKPVSTATQTALDLKAPLASPALTGTPTAPTAVAGTNTTQVATTAYADAAVAALVASAPAALNTLNELATALGNDASFSSTIANSIGLKAPIASPTFTGTVSGITKTMVGLGNVDNTTDALKPVSSATQTALDAKLASATAATTYAPIASPTFTGTVSGVTKAHVGLGNADDTSDANKPVSTATQTALNLKAPVGTPTFTGLVTIAAQGIAFTDGTQTMEGVPSRTPIIQKIDSYTLSALSERDSLIEMNKATAVTVTIPLNATVAYPVGSSIDILQTGAGQVTIAAAAGVTINATPGFKLRTQWSSATLMKRATNTWVIVGDLTA